MISSFKTQAVENRKKEGFVRGFEGGSCDDGEVVVARIFYGRVGGACYSDFIVCSWSLCRRYVPAVVAIVGRAVRDYFDDHPGLQQFDLDVGACTPSFRPGDRVCGAMLPALSTVGGSNSQRRCRSQFVACSVHSR